MRHQDRGCAMWHARQQIARRKPHRVYHVEVADKVALDRGRTSHDIQIIGCEIDNSRFGINLPYIGDKDDRHPRLNKYDVSIADPLARNTRNHAAIDAEQRRFEKSERLAPY